ncbi:MAG: hypothetical protein M1347_07675 [Chloroflexi bacterium]|nr:hypothetical protein [Chloroflexota bacterium]
MGTIIRYSKVDKGPGKDRRFRVASRKPPAGSKPTEYVDKAKALVPAAVVSFWIFVSALIEAQAGDSPSTLLWFVFLLGLIGTYLIENKNLRDSPDYNPKKDKIGWQLALTVFSFVFWVAGLDDGGPFRDIPGFQPIYGQIGVAAWTLLLAPNIPINRQ